MGQRQMKKTYKILISDVESNNILNSLSDRIDLIEKAYNPEGLNLHFDNPPSIELTLFEELLPIGQEAWDIIQNHMSWETSYWFYDFFLLIARASLNILNDKTQYSIPTEVIEKLVILLVDIEQITTVDEYSGDITKRNYEALGNMFLSFDKKGDLQKVALKRANEINTPDVIRFTKNTIKSVKEIEKKS
jgi:hypothetical protein